MSPRISDRAFVWAWLPALSEPVVAGVVAPARRSGLSFQYANSYLDRGEAIALGPDLPLGADVHLPQAGWGMPLSIRDAMPDSWGERVAQHAAGLDFETKLGSIELMLVTGSNRVGALDFQASPIEHTHRGGTPTLLELADGALHVQEDDQLSEPLRLAIRNSMSTPGGAQPKAFVALDGVEYLAKFPVRTDDTPVIKAEAAALHLARNCGIDVPDHTLVSLEGHADVLLTKRFDRAPEEGRRQVISGFTIAKAPWRGGSYPVLADELREHGQEHAGAAVFERVAFGMAIRADDDHLRNISAFWDGQHLGLTPAYDLAPYMGAPGSTSQTAISRGGNRSFTWEALRTHAGEYSLSGTEADEILQSIDASIRDHLADALDLARLGSVEANLVRGAILRPEICGTIR